VIPAADAVRWLVSALAGRATPDELTLRLADRITARGDMVKFFAGNLRYAAFREHEPYVESLEPGRAIVATGPLRWELTAAIEERRPYRIISFAAHELPDETLSWGAAEERMPAVADSDVLGLRVGLIFGKLRLVGLAAAVLRDGQVVHRSFRGLADLPGTPVGPATTFDTGSVAKLVTAREVLRRVSAGDVDLDAPIEQYVPVEGLDSPTVGQLLLHRGGLPRDAVRQQWPPGERAEYSSAGYGLLGRLIGVAEPGRPTASGLRRYGSDQVAATPPYRTRWPGAGGLIATLDDLIAVVKEPFAQTPDTPAGPGVRFAPGIAVLDRPDGALVWRGGAADGFTTEILARADGTAAVILATNLSSSSDLRAEAERLLDRPDQD
jgi:hypothetical protein